MMVTADGCAPLLIDTCGGFELVGQLSRAGFKLADVTNVVVTHRHADHAGGMQALILANRPVVVHALADTHEGIEQMKAGCFPEWGLDNPDWGQQQERFRKTVLPGDVRDIGGFKVEFFEMVHRVPTVAVRVTHNQRTFTYSADSRPCDALVAAARNVDLFLCDALYPETQAERARQLMHPTGREAGVMAAQAGVKALALVHASVNADPTLLANEAREAFGGPTFMPADLSKLPV